MISETKGLLTGTSRRQFVTALAAAGAGALVSSSISQVQGQTPNPRRIDVHHHLISGATSRPRKCAESIVRMRSGSFQNFAVSIRSE